MNIIQDLHPNINKTLNNISLDKKLIAIIKKYIILAILFVIIELILVSSFPIFISLIEISDKKIYSLGYEIINLAINSIFILIIYKDMKKEELKSDFILLITFFNHINGVILFLILLTYKYFKTNKARQHE